MLKLNRIFRHAVDAKWRVIDGKGFACKMDLQRTGLDGDAALLTFTSKSGKHRFSVAISKEDCSELVVHFIGQGAGKIVMPASASRLVLQG